MWYLGTWFSGGLGSSGLRVGLDLRGIFQPKHFHDSRYKACTGALSSLCCAISLANNAHTQKIFKYLRTFPSKFKLTNVLPPLKFRNAMYFLESRILILYSILNIRMHISKQYKLLTK